ncbi:MAG: hydroxymethylbilane synthase [Chthoniobacterales bacterium]
MTRLSRTTIALGTRGSELAQQQTQMVADRLRTRWADLKIETKIVRTSGDEAKSRETIERAGRKGLFTAELERALLAGEVDLAVHSAKDLPSELAVGTEIGAVLPRASAEDLLVSIEPWNLLSLPANGFVATGSTRRAHQLRWKRPDLKIVDLRGNVPTRLRKLATGQWHAIILAGAGLERLRLQSDDHRIRFEGSEFFTNILPPEIFLPAGGQGVIAMQLRTDDERVRLLVEPLNDFDTRWCLRAEREFLRLLHGDCNQPVGVLATLDGTLMKIRAQVFDLGATAPWQVNVEGPSEEAERLAAELLRRIDALRAGAGA